MGASRTGKGTLLAALHGAKIKYFVKNKKNQALADSAISKSAAGLTFMAPVGADDLPAENAIISHQHNSHTLSPKFVENTPQYPDDFSGLQGIHSVDYPGLFESKGPELDISMQLTLHKLITESKKAYVLVLVSAGIFLPDSVKLFTDIKKKLVTMFDQPEKHIVIGITKTKLFEDSLGDADDILSIAKGEDDETLSFKEYECVIVEQDDVSSMQDMIQAVKEKGCAKRYARRGFIDSQEVEKMFARVKPEQDIKTLKNTEWVQMIQQQLSKKVDQPPVPFETIMAEIQESIKSDVFNLQLTTQVLNNLKALIFHQRQTKEMWDSLAEPTQVVSILGQIPEYNFIEKILMSERHYNPALTSSLYQFDLLTLDSLRQTILIIRNDHFATIKGCIDDMKSLLSKKEYDALIQ